MNNFNSPAIGKRVWTESGLHQHGLATGPKTDVPAKTGGLISRIGSSSSGIFSEQALYTIDWDTGQQTFHYGYELICIGSFHTMDEFRDAILLGSDAQITLGPQGGFRFASMVVPTTDGLMSICIEQDQEFIWRSFIEPILKEAKIPILTTRLQRKKPTTKAQREAQHEDNQNRVMLALEKLRGKAG